jgi:hypothetical protein
VFLLKAFLSADPVRPPNRGETGRPASVHSPDRSDDTRLWVAPRVYRPGNDPVSFQFTQVLCEHFLGGLWNRPFEVGKSHGLFPAKVSKDRHFPTAADTAEHVSQTRGAECPVSAELWVFYVPRGFRFNGHAYLFVGAPLNSGFLHLIGGRSTIASGPILCSGPEEKIISKRRKGFKKMKVNMKHTLTIPETFLGVGQS